MCMYCVLYETQEVRITLPVTRDRALSDLLDGHEHACVYPLTADPLRNQTPSPISALLDTYWPETPCRFEARILTCLSERILIHQSDHDQSIHAHCSGIVLFLCELHIFTISILFRKPIVPHSVHCSSSVLSLWPLGRWKIRCHDTIRLDGVFELATLIGWPCEMSLFCSWNVYQTSWSDCWGCGL